MPAFVAQHVHMHANIPLYSEYDKTRSSDEQHTLVGFSELGLLLSDLATWDMQISLRFCEQSWNV